MNEPLAALMLQFLEWLALRPRTYTEAMDAWRSSCPRHTTWEDALVAGLIAVGGIDAESPVTLTLRGRSAVKNVRQERHRVDNERV